MTLSAQTNLFVSAAAADDSRAGNSWENAKKTIGAALNMVSGNTIIHVMVGYYELPEELTIPSWVTVRGGYLPGSTGDDLSHRRNPGGNSYWNDPTACTILSGIPTYRCGNGAGSIAKALAMKSVWGGIYSDNYCVPGMYPENNNATRFSATPAGYLSRWYGFQSNISNMWSSTESYWFSINTGQEGVSIGTADKTAGISPLLRYRVLRISIVMAHPPVEWAFW